MKSTNDENVVIKVVFGKHGGRCDKKTNHDLNRAYGLFNEAFKQSPENKLIAKQMYEEAIRLDPFFVDAMVNLGSILADLKQLRKAKMTWLEAEALNSSTSSTVSMLNFNLGNLAIDHDLDEAIQRFGKCIALQPEFTTAHLNLAHVYQRAGLHESAKKHLQKVLELEPNHEYRDKILEAINHR